MKFESINAENRIQQIDSEVLTASGPSIFSKCPPKSQPRTAHNHAFNAAIDVAGGVNFRIQNQPVASDAHSCDSFSRSPVQQARQKDMTPSTFDKRASVKNERNSADLHQARVCENSRNKKHDAASWSAKSFGSLTNDSQRPLSTRCWRHAEKQNVVRSAVAKDLHSPKSITAPKNKLFRTKKLTDFFHKLSKARC